MPNIKWIPLETKELQSWCHHFQLMRWARSWARAWAREIPSLLPLSHVIKSYVRSRNAGINFTGYHPPHPPGLTPGPLIFSVKISTSGTTFQCKTPAPRSKKWSKIPTPGHNLTSLNAKISMKKERNSIRAAFFQIFYCCPFDNFLLLWE